MLHLLYSYSITFDWEIEECLYCQCDMYNAIQKVRPVSETFEVVKENDKGAFKK